MSELDITTPVGRAALRAIIAGPTLGPWVVAAARSALPVAIDTIDRLTAELLSLRTCPECGIRYDRANGGLCRCGTARLTATLTAELAASNDPQLDGTEAAHPSYWRGNEAATFGVAKMLRETLDGKDNGGGVISYAPLEQVRRDVLRLTADNERLRAYLLQLLDARDSPPSDEPNTDYLSARLDQIEDVLRGLS